MGLQAIQQHDHPGPRMGCSGIVQSEPYEDNRQSKQEG